MLWLQTPCFLSLKEKYEQLSVILLFKALGSSWFCIQNLGFRMFDDEFNVLCESFIDVNIITMKRSNGD